MPVSDVTDFVRVETFVTNTTYTWEECASGGGGGSDTYYISWDADDNNVLSMTPGLYNALCKLFDDDVPVNIVTLNREVRNGLVTRGYCDPISTIERVDDTFKFYVGNYQSFMMTLYSDDTYKVEYYD